MARPQKQTVEYFPHYTSHKKTMFIIESRWGNDGFAFWFKLLEMLGKTPGHLYDCNKPDNWEFLLAKTRLGDITATEMLDKLAELDAIDPALWERKLIWSQNFVDGLEPVYKKRKVEIPTKPSFRDGNPICDNVSGAGNPQSRVEKSKEEKSNPPTPLAGGEVESGEQRKRAKTPSNFDRFWQAYPKRKSRGQAEKVWAKIKPSEQLLSLILEALERAKTSEEWTRDNGRYIPYPATWLNAKGWEDEYTPAGSKARAPTSRQKERDILKELYI